MKSRLFARSFATKLSVLVAGLLLMITGCQHEDSETLATNPVFAAISVAGDFIRALLAAFLF